MARWIKAHWADEAEDVTFLWELDDGGWVTRSVELEEPDRRVQAAASRIEVLEAQGAGIEAVREYESRFGVLPERPLDTLDFPHESIMGTDADRAAIARVNRALGLVERGVERADER